MKKEHLEILMQGNDLLITQISNSIPKEKENRERLREFLKKAIEAGDELKKLQDEAE